VRYEPQACPLTPIIWRLRAPNWEIIIMKSARTHHYLFTAKNTRPIPKDITIHDDDKRTYPIMDRH
jgi:hypothetical protein